MKLFDYIRMALKNLSRRKVRTVLTIIAITVGSFSLILMISIIVSIKQSLTEEFDQLGAFDLVTVIKDPNSTNSSSLISGGNGDPSEGKMIDDAALAQMLKLDHVADGTATLSNFSISTMKLEGQDKKAWASILAYDPGSDVFHITMAYGRMLNSSDMDKIVIGSRFIQDIGYQGNPGDLIGKHVLLNSKMGTNIAPDWGDPPEKPPANAGKEWYESQGNQGRDIPAEIVGITASSAVDDGQSYITMAWGRRLMTNVSWQYPECQKDQPCTSTLQLVKDDNFTRQGYSSIILKADDKANINLIADEVKKLGYGANTAEAMLAQINQILFIISIVLAVIGGISLFVATIGIVNTMVMATFERTREIGVMRACGATRATIRRLFTIEAGLLGFWGGFCGLIISIGLGQVAKLIVSKNSMTLGSLPVQHIGNFPWWLILGVLAFTTLLGMISGLFPAIRAAHMDPVDALRDE